MGGLFSLSTLRGIFFKRNFFEEFYADLYVRDKTEFWCMVLLQFLIVLAAVHFSRVANRKRKEYNYSTLYTNNKLYFFLGSLFYATLIDGIGWLIGWWRFIENITRLSIYK